jgi:hypothetical protein
MEKDNQGNRAGNNYFFGPLHQIHLLEVCAPLFFKLNFAAFIFQDGFHFMGTSSFY